MSLVSVLLFFLYTWGAGFSITRYVKESSNYLERNIMRIGIGLGVLPILIVLLNLFKIPIDWRIFFVITLAMPAYYLYKSIGQSKLSMRIRIKKSDIIILVMLVFFFATLYMYTKGAFSYPWYENTDPWSHAAGSKFVSIEKTLIPPLLEKDRLFGYMDPYPPSYDGLMGILKQTSDSIMWVIKFFNALIISLSIPFFFFFSKRFLGNPKKALFATFTLTVVPSFLSHFIWAFSLIIPVGIVCFYSLEMLKKDRKWGFIIALITASILVIQPSMSIKLGFMLLLYWLVKAIYERSFKWDIIIPLSLGLLLAVAVWWTPAVVRHGGVSEMLGKLGGGIVYSHGTLGEDASLFKYAGSADRIYTFKDFFIVGKHNMINNPVGLGVFITILLLISVFFFLLVLITNYKSIFKKENSYLMISAVWLLYAFLGVHGARLPVQFWAFRFWMLFALTVSLFVPFGLWKLFELGKKFKVPAVVISLIFIIGFIFTSGIQKYSVNTALWMPERYLVNDELTAYLWLKDQLPPDTPVYGFSHAHGQRVLALEKYTCYWCLDEYNTRVEGKLINMTSDEIYTFLKSKNYQYTIIDVHYVQKYGVNKTNAQIQSLINSGKFVPVLQNQGAVILKLL